MAIPMGQLITPSSVAGSGVSLSGAKVTFSGATSVSVNGCFDSTYDNYLVVLASQQNYAAANYGPKQVSCRLRVGGVDASATQYARQEINAYGTSIAGFRGTSQSSWTTLFYHYGNNLRNGSHLYFYGPSLSQPTAVRSVNVDSFGSARILDNAGTHSASTAYDGFTLTVTSDAMTGSLTIYGLAN